MNLSNREKVLLAVLLVVALFYGYYKFFLSGMLDTISEKKTSIQSLQQQEQKIREASATKDKLNSELNEAMVLYNASLLEIPKQYRNSEIAYRLKELCDANSTVLSSVSFGTASPVSRGTSGSSGSEDTNTQETQETQGSQETNAGAGGLYSVSVSMSITGSYNAIMNLVDAIENDTRTSHVESIGITSSSSGGDLSANLSLTFYYMGNGGDEEETYYFNTGTYGKSDLFN